MLSMMIGIRAELSGIQILAAESDFLFSETSRPTQRYTQPTILWISKLVPCVKPSVREFDHAPQSSSEVKNESSYTSFPLYSFLALKGTILPFLTFAVLI